MDFFTFDSLNLLTSALVILGIQVIFFIFAVTLKTDKVTDLSYSLTFVVTALLFLFALKQPSVMQVLVAVFITLWGARLGSYLFIRIIKLKKDDRFDGIREKPLSFSGFWLLQAVTIWVVMLPATVLLSKEQSLSPTVVTWIGAVLWIIGFVVESIADSQKYRFRKDPANQGKWIQSGLWKHSRHPNYFGEMVCWWALFIITIPHLQGVEWFTLIGPLFLTFLLLRVSGIPTVEKKAEQKYGDNPEFQEYKKRTGTLIPLPRRKTD